MKMMKAGNKKAPRHSQITSPPWLTLLDYQIQDKKPPDQHMKPV
jgi:hypothetical protein